MPKPRIRRHESTLVAVALVMILGRALPASAGLASQPGTRAADSAPIRFAVIGDFGLAGSAESAVADRVKSWNPDFILTVGDNNYPSGAAATIDANIGQYYHDFIHPYAGIYGDAGIENAFFPALGNHDWATAGAQPYLDFFTLPGNERYYDLVRGPVHFFMLDSDSHEPDGNTAASAQAAWLQAAQAASTSSWNLILLHHAPFSSGPHGDSTALQWPYEAWGADAVLAGHDHTYERIIHGGIPYFVDGLGGAAPYSFGTPVSGSEVRYNSSHGAMKVEASQSTITFEFITDGGTVVDTFKLPRLTISGNAGVRGVTLTYEDYARRSAASNATGDYSFTVPRGWSGTVTPSKPGYHFLPPHVDYPALTADQADQDYTAVGHAPTDFDCDSITDPSKYVPSAGAVYYYQSSTSTWGSTYIGTDGEYILNSDFDGDGMVDAAKYVDAAGAIWYFGSDDSLWHGIYIGSDGDFIPASDFDGDGKTDPAKYVAAAGAVWYFGSADSTWYGVYIGDLGGGEYIPGSDFDGDGKTDPAKYVAGGVYWFKSSTSTWDSQYIGADGTYIPRSDYDGDGKVDPAKFVSPYIAYLPSDSSYAITYVELGADATFVVPGSDFDGDGITDFAKFVYSAPHGLIWYTRSSDAGSVGVYMGADTYDIVN